MDSKTLNVLEYPKILGQLAGFCDFSASMDLARALEPTSSFELANARIAETTEARKLLSMESTGVGAAHDIRPQADLAARGGVLDPHALLDVKSTLISCRDLKKSFEKRAEEYPRLTQIVLTAKLKTIEFSEYVEKCCQFAAEFLGVSIPLPQ